MCVKRQVDELGSWMARLGVSLPGSMVCSVVLCSLQRATGVQGRLRCYPTCASLSLLSNSECPAFMNKYHWLPWSCLDGYN